MEPVPDIFPDMSEIFEQVETALALAMTTRPTVATTAVTTVALRFIFTNLPNTVREGSQLAGRKPLPGL
jgi:hypothetical protein